MSGEKYGFRNFSFCDTHTEVVDSLCKIGGSRKYFDNMYELFTFAACIGFQNKRKTKSIKTGKSIEFNQFRSFDNFDGIFLSICLADYKDATILKDDEINISLRMSIFSEYANGGMEIITEQVLGTNMNIEEDLIHFIQANGVNFKTKEQDVNGLSKFVHILEGL